jgi:hypothetical protein
MLKTSVHYLRGPGSLVTPSAFPKRANSFFLCLAYGNPRTSHSSLVCWLGKGVFAHDLLAGILEGDIPESFGKWIRELVLCPLYLQLGIAVGLSGCEKESGDISD